MTQADKVRENRLRRRADRLGLVLLKSRRRDVEALDYGRYFLMQADTRIPIHAGIDAINSPYSETIEDVEEWLVIWAEDVKKHLQVIPRLGTSGL